MPLLTDIKGKKEQSEMLTTGEIQELQSRAKSIIAMVKN